MSEKRVKHEIKTIIILGILVVLVFGLTFLVKTLSDNNVEEVDYSSVQATGTWEMLKVTSLDIVFTLTSDRGNWTYVEQPEIPIEGSTAVTVSSAFKELKPDRTLENATAYWNEFGLGGDGLRRFDVKTDTCEKSYILGNYNPVLESYYLRIEGDQNVYIIPDNQVAMFNKNLLNYVSRPVVNAVPAKEIKKIDVRGPETGYSAERKSDGNFRITENGKSYDGNNYGALNMFTAIQRTNFSECFGVNVAKEEYPFYGMDDPEITAIIETGETKYKIAISQKDDSYYFMENNTGVVFKIDEDEYTYALEATDPGNIQ